MRVVQKKIHRSITVSGPGELVAVIISLLVYCQFGDMTIRKVLNTVCAYWGWKVVAIE